jgi:dipeptidase
MTRDQYEGSPFDMTTNVDGGPFGDPMRYGPVFKWQDTTNGVSFKAFENGIGFQRPISLWRTSYATVTTSRKDLPDEVGAMTWIAPYAPHHSSFVPVYAHAEKTPSTMNSGM